ncbi:MAG: hypothetical protein ACKOXP_07325 [Flavobacteriales bacterium]
MKKRSFYVTVCWIVFSRSFDAYCTNLQTPDLQKEANPLVSSLGLTWSPLLLILGLLLIYVIYAFYQAVFHPIKLNPTEKGWSFQEFVTFRYLGKKAHWTSLLFQFPSTPKRFHQVMGPLFATCLSFAGIISTVMWILIFNSSWYRSVHHAGLIYGLLISGCLYICYASFRKNYSIYVSIPNERT